MAVDDTTSSGAKPPVTEQGYASIQPPPWNTFIGAQSEDVPDLAWPNSTVTYHKMRTDSQVDSLSKAITLPIRRFRWMIDPNGARDEIVEEIANDWGLPIMGTDHRPGRSKRRFNHDDHLRHSLLGLSYGHMFFEQFGEIVDGKWRMRKLAPRMPQSLAQILINDQGGLAGIIQFGRNGMTMAQSKPLKVDVLAAYVWDREGANWAGRSLLRPLYKHWLVVDRLYRVDAMKHEKYGLGIAKGKAPKGANESVVTQYGSQAQGIQADPRGGVGVPDGGDVYVEGVRGALPDTLASIRMHHEQMARDFLAMFLMLGQTLTGSRALGQAFADFFQLSIEAIAHWYARISNEYAIEDQVDWNYGENEQAPLLVYDMTNEEEPITTKDLLALEQAGAIVMDDDMRAWVRDRWNLPQQADTGGIVPPVPPENVPIESPAAQATLNSIFTYRRNSRDWARAAARRERERIIVHTGKHVAASAPLWTPGR